MPSCPIKMSRFLKFSRGSEFQFTRLDMAAPWGQYWRYLCKQNMHRYIYIEKIHCPFWSHAKNEGTFFSSLVTERFLRQ